MRLPILVLAHIATAHRLDLYLTATTGEGSNTSSIAATALQNSTAVLGTNGSDRGVLSRVDLGISRKLMQRLALILAASTVLGGPLRAVQAKAMPIAMVVAGFRQNALSGSGFRLKAMEAAGPGSGIPDPSERDSFMDEVKNGTTADLKNPLRGLDVIGEGELKIELEDEYQSYREEFDQFIRNDVDAVPHTKIEEVWVLFKKMMSEEDMSSRGGAKQKARFYRAVETLNSIEQRTEDHHIDIPKPANGNFKEVFWAASRSMFMLTRMRMLARKSISGPMQFNTGTEARLLLAVRESFSLARRAPRNSVAQTPADQEPADRVLQAADRFCWDVHWMMLVGDVKGRILDSAVRERVAAVDPRLGAFTALEFGTYVGYSAVRIARLLPEGARLYSVDPEGQELAHELVSLAELLPKVTFIQANADEAIDRLRAEHVKIDFVFIDHEKSDYLPSLRRLEESGMLRVGAVVVADNVDVFRIDDYLSHVRNPRFYQSRHIDAALEYTDNNPDGSPSIRDGVEVSTYVGRNEFGREC